MISGGQEHIADLLRIQAELCHRFGSSLYSVLLDAAAADVEGGGPAWELLAPHEADTAGSALALRFAGAVHRLVLEGRAPDLASFYPSAGGRADPAGAWPAYRRVLEEHPGRLRELLERPVQTNEVGRSAALLGSFLLVARITGLPLALLELGAASGLNLRWDHFRYESAGWAFGDPASPVRFEEVFKGDRRPPLARVEVVERRGCDLSPIDPHSTDGVLTLRSYVWPDQHRRRFLLDAGLETARRVPVQLEKAEASDWLATRLEILRPGVATVIFHSIVMQYLGEEHRDRVVELMERAGRAATPIAPLAWLRLEPTRLFERGPTGFEVHLSLWLGGKAREERLASSGPHGPPVRWLSG